MVLGLLADQVDQPARFQGAIEQRGRALEHLDALGGGVEIARQVAAHAIAQDRAVGVAAEAALDEAVLGTSQGVALGHATDEFHGLVQRADPVVLESLRGHHLQRLRLFLERDRGLAGRTGLLGAIPFLDFLGGLNL
ncbi:hypothetical protein D3C78_1450760 [compost metagenome]